MLVSTARCRRAATVMAALAATSASPCIAALPATPTAIAGTVAYGDAPAGFDAVAGSDAQLAAFGFPPRPNPLRSPRAYAAWRDAVGSMHRIVPMLQSVPLRHGPMQRVAMRNGLPGGPVANIATSTNWSGYVVAAPAYFFGAASLDRIHADWIVPVAQPGFGMCARLPDGDAVYSSSWVGLDGDGSADVLQAGTESDAVCSQGAIGSYQAVWYEWYPDDEVRITNLPVQPGDAIYVSVWATSAAQGHAYIVNKTERQVASVAFTAPAGSHLTGNSAEWIVERPVVNGVQARLTNYVQEYISTAEAEDGQQTPYYPGNALIPGRQPGLQVQMINADSQIISVPTLLGADAISFTNHPFAR